DFIRPFDLTRSPLMRSALVEHPGGHCTWMVDMHHIITDGTSVNILGNEFMALYSGETLPPLRVHYKDFSTWRDGETMKESIKLQETFWLEQYRDEAPVLNLPIDFPRPPVQGFEGDRSRFELSPRQTKGLKEMALFSGATLYMVLLAVIHVWLSKISGQEDIITGAPLAGRGHEDLRKIIGMFINTLAPRNFPRSHLTFNAFLQQVKTNTLRAFDNQDYQLEDLAQLVSGQVYHDAGHNPLFDVMFQLETFDNQTLEIPGLTLKPFPLEHKIAKFDIALNAWEDDQQLCFSVEYCTRLYKEETILRLSRYFKRIIDSVLEDPDREIARITLISEDEKRRVLFDFNQSHIDYPGDRTLHRMFEDREEKNPHRTALIFKDRTLTYRQLNHRSNLLAAVLREKGTVPGTVVALMLERSLEMIIGIFGILKAGGAYLPVDPDYPEERVNYMLKDSGAGILLSNLGTGNALNAASLNSPLERGTRRRRGGGVATGETASHKANQLCYIIYTSGSTGNPKGVVTTHYNAARVIDKTNYIQITPKDRLLQWSNYAFDGSIFDIYGALCNGAALVMLSGGEAANPGQLADVICRESVTVFFVTTALFNLLVDQQPRIFANLRKILFGGEQVSAPHTRRALEHAGKGKIIHVYGPTEATVFATYYPVDHIEKNVDTIAIGQPLSYTALYILDVRLQPAAIGLTGEIYIGGSGIARGYLNRPGLTARRFVSNPFVGEDRLYKTGDLARWLPDGNIRFIGRTDHQVKIRGFRIELGEIQAQLMKHPQVKDSVVVVMGEQSNDKTLCAYFVPVHPGDSEHSPPEPSQIKKFLSVRLPAYLVPSYLVPLEQIPLSHSGKVDRNALPDPMTVITGDSVSLPRDEIQRRLVEIWVEVLDIEERQVGIDSDFFEVGGHSLKATLLTAAVHKAFHVKVTLADLFREPTIRALAQFIRQSGKTRFVDLEKIEEREFYPLSFNQKRLWFLHRLEPSGSFFNMPGRIPLEGPVEVEHIRRILAQLVERHESFRTGFKEVRREPVQFVVDGADIPFEFIDMSDLEPRQKERERHQAYHHIARSPFDLEQPPIFRTLLVKLSEDRYELMINKHHIITDGWSDAILTREFLHLYDGYRSGNGSISGNDGNGLQPMELQYKDFCHWHNRQMNDPRLSQESRAFWRAKLENGFPALRFPAAFYEHRDNRAGAGWMAGVNRQMLDRLDRLAQTHNTSLFMVLFSVYILTLNRFTHQEEIVCSIISAGREHISLKNIIGFFVNSIPFDTRVRRGEPFGHFLRRVKDDTLEVFKHQHHPIELVADELKIRVPEISVSINMTNITDAAQMEEIESFEPYHIDETQDARFDLETYFTPCRNGIRLYWNYKKKMFRPDTIAYIADEYMKMLEFFAENSSGSYENYEETLKETVLWDEI
ncbi:MAG: amino acid adenylation domain-containing protein, partial [bacterium]|nr:amino acid adenylation domain-containing protein [bacterium]